MNEDVKPIIKKIVPAKNAKYKSNDLISFFAYASASLFIVQLFQYYYVNYKNSKVVDKFLFHSFVGGSVWVLFIIIMICRILTRIPPRVLPGFTWVCLSCVRP